MKRISFLLFLVFLSLNIFAQTPVSLHPDNPHYFLFRGKPLILISSAEHYGMVLNSKLDFEFYLDKMENEGFNQTRIFSGVYCEGPGFIDEGGHENKWDEIQNTLAPRPGMLMAPWKRSNVPGYANGGNKFDLDQWDEAYFDRLKNFCREAGRRQILVEMVLFTANYTTQNWKNSPLHARNNINHIGEIPYNEFHLLKHEAVIGRQLQMVRKIVQELNEFDNVYFEICNEPYWMKGIPRIETSIKEQQFLPEIDDWQNRIVREIVETERELPNKHLIALNIANTYYKVQTFNPEVSVLNFHYAYPPGSVTDNYHLNLPIAFDETADGCNAPDRRREAWAFILSGGAVYSNLDWSFATDDLTGRGRNPSGRRVSGREVREQLRFLSGMLRSFDFIGSEPVGDAFRQDIPEGISLFGLMKSGTDYLFYWLKSRKARISKWECPLPAGMYKIEFYDPVEGKVLVALQNQHDGGNMEVEIPDFPDDLVLRIRRTDGY